MGKGWFVRIQGHRACPERKDIAADKRELSRVRITLYLFMNKPWNMYEKTNYITISMRYED